MNSITLAADDSPALTEPPDHSKAGDRNAALLFLACDFTPFPGVNADTDRVIAAIAVLRAEGWTPVSARAAVDCGARPALRVIHGGGDTAPAMVPAFRLAVAS